MKKIRNYALEIELLIMIIIFLVCMAIMSKAFVMARGKASDASRLSKAVSMSADVAEVFLSSDDMDEMTQILEKENMSKENNSFTFIEDGLELRYNEKNEAGMRKAEITVTYQNNEIYTLSTAKKGEK